MHLLEKHQFDDLSKKIIGAAIAVHIPQITPEEYAAHSTPVRWFPPKGQAGQAHMNAGAPTTAYDTRLTRKHLRQWRAGCQDSRMEQICDILEATLPIIALIDPGKIYGGISGIGHFVVILGRMDNKVVYHDPVMGQNLVTEEEIFFQAWQESNFRGVRIWKSTER